jgi:hypothetical protein
MMRSPFRLSGTPSPDARFEPAHAPRGLEALAGRPAIASAAAGAIHLLNW